MERSTSADTRSQLESHGDGVRGGAWDGAHGPSDRTRTRNSAPHRPRSAAARGPNTRRCATVPVPNSTRAPVNSARSAGKRGMCETTMRQRPVARPMRLAAVAASLSGVRAGSADILAACRVSARIRPVSVVRTNGLCITTSGRRPRLRSPRATPPISARPSAVSGRAESCPAALLAARPWRTRRTSRTGAGSHAATPLTRPCVHHTLVP